MNQKLYVTEEGYRELEKKKDQLLEAQAKNIKDIDEARGQGDLSENADYAAAREEQGRIAQQLNEIEYNLKNAVIITGEEDNNIGKYIDINFLEENVIETYKLVGVVEADPLMQKISNESPLGNAVFNAKAGDVVLVKTEDGEQFEVKVERIYVK